MSSIVRIKDKKSGSIRVYESISHYDPVTQKSRPTKKYLGIEDPETGELIPSCGRRGRRKNSVSEETALEKTTRPEKDYRPLYEKLKLQCHSQEETIRELRQENTILYAKLEKLHKLTSDALALKQTYKSSQQD